MPPNLRRAAIGALLTAPILAAPLTTAPRAAATTARPATPATSCQPPGHHPPARPGHQARPGTPSHDRTQPLIGNLSPAPGSTVPAAATITFLIADQQPFPAPLSGDATVTVNHTPVTATPGTEQTGIPVTYANQHRSKPRPARCEIPFTFTLPADITGTAHIQVTAHGSNHTTDTARWTLTIQTTTVPTGATGGIILTTAAGLTLLTIQARRRRRTPPHTQPPTTPPN